ncbi:MAG: HlyD family efflux transporter periplasmic adaptor subunit [Bacteroidetes bacterium]|nr:HlyD family efflux transporter periplasmic adaptor subunit [Bacteroidota bacterium]
MEKPKVENAPKTSASILTSKLSNGSQSTKGEGLDRRLEKKMWTKQRIVMAVAILAFLAMLSYGYSTTTGGRRLNIDRDKITVATVVRGPFQENIAVTGNVLPLTTVYLDAVDGGRVEEIYVLEGTTVEKGDPLLRLSNNNLELSLIGADAQRIEQINRLEDIRFRMKQNTLNLRQQLVDMDYRVQRLETIHTRSKELYDRQLISQQEYEEVKFELDFWRRNKRLTLDGYRQDSTQMVTQLTQIGASVRRMETNYGVLQRILDNLTLRAPVSGHLTALDAEIGELRTAGFRFGQIDVLTGYKVRAGVDEYYIARVNRSQTAMTQPIAGKEYRMKVNRVYPEVREGRFEVDLEFVGEVPSGIRRGQTIRFLLEMSDPAEALLLPKGGFFQSTGGNWVYVLDPSGDFAVKRTISIGRQNTQNYELMEGLEPGDQVVTSSYDTFGDADRLVW